MEAQYQAAPEYPVRVSAEYLEPLSRLSTFFRLILLIPVLIVVGLLSGGDFLGEATDEGFYVTFGALGSLVLVHWIAVFIRRRPVNWVFDAIVHIERFSLRALAYALLLVDKYPAFEGDWQVQYEVDRPEELSRWKILVWKVITLIPHFFLLLVLGFVVIVVVIVSWFAILFTARYPRGLHNLVTGWIRWRARVFAYLFSLTDVYPPFTLD